MIEQCSGLCSELKLGFFLDALTAIGTLLMAGVAIGAANAWRLQKKNELARETYEFVLDLHDTTSILISSMVKARDSIYKAPAYDSIRRRHTAQIERIQFSTKYASLCAAFLKERELAEDILNMQKKASALINALISMSDENPRARAVNFLSLCGTLSECHRELIENNGLSIFKKNCEKHLLKYF